MAIELVVPIVGESITEVEIGDWLKKEGEPVNQDDPLVVIETEKVTIELPAPAAGTISRVLKHKGDRANVGDVIGYMEPDGVRPSSASRSSQAEAAIPQAETVPVALNSGKDEVKTQPVIVPQANAAREEQIVPMTPIRRRIAERLVEAQKTAALLTTFNQIDMSAVATLRREHQEAFRSKYGVKLGIMSFFVKALIEALKLFPPINAEIRGQNIVYRNYYDVGVAIGTTKGLVVPVLRNAERMSFGEIEQAIADFAQRARDGQLRIDELQGGTFSISNGGVYGSMLSTPIVNPPQSGILGLHAIEDRPVAVNGAVVIRPMMYVALTYDHRIVDGREAVAFLKRIKEIIQEPARMLLEI